MSEEKRAPGFMIYAEQWAVLYEDYNATEIGKLLQAAINYFQTGQDTEFADRGMRAAFRGIRTNIDLDGLRYNRKINQSKYAAFCRVNGLKEGDPNRPPFDDWWREYGDNYNQDD